MESAQDWMIGIIIATQAVFERKAEMVKTGIIMTNCARGKLFGLPRVDFTSLSRAPVSSTPLATTSKRPTVTTELFPKPERKSCFSITSKARRTTDAVNIAKSEATLNAAIATMAP